MPSFGSIDAFLRFLATRPAAVDAAQRAGLEEAGVELAEEAKALIGTEDEAWAPLAASTVEEKERLGFTGRVSATDPLLRTGELRATISHRVDGDRVTIGTDDPIAAFQEFGTSRIPGRPFIALTVFRHGHEAAHAIMGRMMAAAMGRSPPGRKVSR